MAFHHCVLGKSWVWLFLLGLAPFAFCFVSLLDGEAHIWLGDLRFAPCGLCLCFVCAFDLPSYMTTGVYVDVILHCFFSCKDRASERDRPYRREKKNYIKEASSVTGKSQGGTMPLPSDIPASPRQMYANCWTVKHTTTKSALLGQEDSSHWLGCPVPKMQLQARFLLCLG